MIMAALADSAVVPPDLIGLALGPEWNLYVPLAISGKVLRFDL